MAEKRRKTDSDASRKADDSSRAAVAAVASSSRYVNTSARHTDFIQQSLYCMILVNGGMHDLVGNTLSPINLVALCWARLVPGLVTLYACEGSPVGTKRIN